MMPLAVGEIHAGGVDGISVSLAIHTEGERAIGGEGNPEITVVTLVEDIAIEDHVSSDPSVAVSIDPMDAYFAPYYRFYVELDRSPAAGFKCYGEFDVPAVNSKYIAN